MQITPPVPLPPVSTNVAQPQAIVNGLPQHAAQAVTPISQKAIAPTPKAERGQKPRKRGELEREDKTGQQGENHGDHVNLSV